MEATIRAYETNLAIGETSVLALEANLPTLLATITFFGAVKAPWAAIMGTSKATNAPAGTIEVT